MEILDHKNKGHTSLYSFDAVTGCMKLVYLKEGYLNLVNAYDVNILLGVSRTWSNLCYAQQDSDCWWINGLPLHERLGTHGPTDKRWTLEREQFVLPTEFQDSYNHYRLDYLRKATVQLGFYNINIYWQCRHQKQYNFHYCLSRLKM